MPSGPIVSLVNRTTKKCLGGQITAAQFAAYAKAQQIQVDRDLAPLWGVGARVLVNSTSKTAWKVIFVDESDLDGALGYHWTVNGAGDGLPVAYVGVATARKYNQAWQVTGSHEVAEMLVDPTCNLVMPYGAGRSVAQEVGDPVQSDRYAYNINRVPMSNFVTPAWFTGTGTRYDFGRVLKKPLTLAPGGYISVFDGTSWSQEFARSIKGEVSRIVTSTRHRRHVDPYGAGMPVPAALSAREVSAL